MNILIATLLIDLATLAHFMELDSPRRLPSQKHAAIDEAGFSGRTEEEALSADLEMEEENKYVAEAFATISHHNDNGIFYEENGRLYAVRTGMPLLEDRGIIVGRPKNGYVAPVYDSDGFPVQVPVNNYKMQTFLHEAFVRMSHRPIPRLYIVVPARLPREPKVLYSDASIKPGKQKVKELDESYYRKPNSSKI